MGGGGGKKYWQEDCLLILHVSTAAKTDPAKSEVCAVLSPAKHYSEASQNFYCYGPKVMHGNVARNWAVKFH